MSGFTLIELMITVAIVAILASVAYPAYTSSVQKGRRAEGRAGLTALMQQQERYFTLNGSYLAFNGPTDTPTDAANNTASIKNYSGDGANTSSYTLGAANCPNITNLRLCVVVFARPVRSDSNCGTLTIQSTGLQRGYGTGLTFSGAGSATAMAGTPTTTDTNGCWR